MSNMEGEDCEDHTSNSIEYRSVTREIDVINCGWGNKI